MSRQRDTLETSLTESGRNIVKDKIEKKELKKLLYHASSKCI